jgi:hypothetical protein
MAKTNGNTVARGTYTSTRDHLLINGVGHLWPDNEDNRKAGKPVEVILPVSEAERYGDALRKTGTAKAAEPDESKPGPTTETK